MSTMRSSPSTSVKDFYRDRSIFITGGTGFMGKVLVEKLLRSCPGIKNIYLLMRPKKGQDVQQRLQELLNGPVRRQILLQQFIHLQLSFVKNFFKDFVGFVEYFTMLMYYVLQLFEKLRRDSPHELTKVIPVAGDVTEHELGISEADRSEHFDKMRLGRLPLRCHGKIRRGAETLGHHQHARHQAALESVPSHAQFRSENPLLSSQILFRAAARKFLGSLLWKENEKVCNEFQTIRGLRNAEGKSQRHLRNLSQPFLSCFLKLEEQLFRNLEARCWAFGTVNTFVGKRYCCFSEIFISTVFTRYNLAVH